MPTAFRPAFLDLLLVLGLLARALLLLRVIPGGRGPRRGEAHHAADTGPAPRVDTSRRRPAPDCDDQGFARPAGSPSTARNRGAGDGSR